MEIEKYLSYDEDNSTEDVTFNGLIQYYPEDDYLNNIKLCNSGVVLVNIEKILNIKVFPQLRTKVLYDNGLAEVIVYENNKRPISVIATMTISTDDGEFIKIENIGYNKLYSLPINNIRSLRIKIEFDVNSSINLLKTIQFFYLPDLLYNWLYDRQDYTFDAADYASIIDKNSGQPIVSKWGCLLSTNSHDVIETKEIEENNEISLKGIAELIPTTKVRLGNLSGIYNKTFGTNQPKGFGLYGDSVYLTGNFYLNNGKSLVDINDDVIMASGNINRINETLYNLDSSLHDSIYNLMISLNRNYSDSYEHITLVEELALLDLETAKQALTSTFTSAIAANSEALFKLGKDYALWAVGNAGISIINPNVQYDPDDGSIIDSTVGDGDEYIVLQGERVQISTNVVKNQRVKVICSNTDPTSFIYDNNNLYTPTGPNGLLFFVGWIPQGLLTTGTRKVVTPIEVYDDNGTLVTTNKPFRNVALVKHPLDYYNSNITLASDLSNCNFYSFSNSLQLSGTLIYTTYNGDTKLNNNSNSTYYVVQDITTAGMFVDGKFNADLIEVANILAMDLYSEENEVKKYKKNPNFDITRPINNSNYPVLKNLLVVLIAKDAPFVVVSGTTGKVTAQGMLMKEATIGETSGKHIRIADNSGILVNGDNYPAIYFKDGNSSTTVKISSDLTSQLSDEFNNNDEETLANNDVVILYNGITRLTKTVNGLYLEYNNDRYTWSRSIETNTNGLSKLGEGRHYFSGCINISNFPIINPTLTPYIEGYYECKLSLICYSTQLEFGEKVLKTWHYLDCINRNRNLLVLSIINDFNDDLSFNEVVNIPNVKNLYLKFKVDISFYLRGKVVTLASEISNEDFELNIIDGTLYTPKINTLNNKIAINDESNPSGYDIINNFKFNYNIKHSVFQVNEKTLIQGNGFLTGFNKNNYFDASFIEDENNKVYFNNLTIVYGVGLSISNNGIQNIFNNYRIKTLVPILYGSIIYLGEDINGNRGSYSFYGNSLIYDSDGLDGVVHTMRELTDPIISNRELFIDNSMITSNNIRIKPLQLLSDLTEEEQLSKIGTNNIYLYSITGKIILLFGNKWNDVFNQYGRNIFVLIYPKYCQNFKPIVANFIGIITLTNLVEIKGSVYEGYGMGIAETLKNNSLGLQFNSYDIDGNLADGNFDIVVQYIPNLK